MKDLDHVHHFIGIEISQSHYTLTILERANMIDCKPMSIPLEAKTKTSSADTPLDDLSYFQGLVGSLQYLTLTRPDLSYDFNFLSQFMHALNTTLLKMVNHILHFVKETLHTRLFLTSQTTLDLSVFSDAN